MSKAKSLAVKLKEETKSLKDQINALVAEKEAELIKSASLTDKVMYFIESKMNRSTIEETLFKGYNNQAKEFLNFKAQLSAHNIGYELAEEVGGDTEEDGSTYFKVYNFSDGVNECWIKFDGWYSSYDGSELRSYFPVKPVIKQVTVFEMVK
jgi:hypothetical protein